MAFFSPKCVNNTSATAESKVSDMSQTRECATARWGLRLKKKKKKKIPYCDSNQAKIKLKEGLSECCKSLCKWKRRNAPLADLAEALLQGGWDFSIQDLQNRLDVFPGGVSAQIAGEETKEVCGRTDRKTDRHHRRSALNHRNAGIRRGSCGEEKTRTAASVVDETTSTWHPGSGRETTRSKYGQRGNVRMRKNIESKFKYEKSLSQGINWALCLQPVFFLIDVCRF